MFRVLFGVLAGVFLIAPVVSGEVKLDLAQISIATQTILEKAILVGQLIASEGQTMNGGVNHAV
jgi:hypothetical protein